MVGKFGEGPFSVSELQALNIWARGTWYLRHGLQASVFGGSLLLFEFEDRMEAEMVLVRGSRRFNERLLSLERWQHETGCEVKKGSCKEAWVRVLGLPLHLWSLEVFKKVGDCCGGFIAVDEAFQGEATRYTSRSSYSLVLWGLRGFSSSSPSCRKRVAKGDCSFVCG